MEINDEIREIIIKALEEDIGPGDVTSESLVPPGIDANAYILTKEECILAGMEIAKEVFISVDDSLEVIILVSDGKTVPAGTKVLTVKGNASSILTAERTALNFIQRLSGIATLTGKFVDMVQEFDTDILDTRKTTPTLRSLEKYAVWCGGGTNHRFGLYDKILIKDNHRALWGNGSLAEAVSVSREKHPELEIEIEVESIEELKDALGASPDWVLLDNMPPEDMKNCVDLAKDKCKLEASGNIDLNNVKAAAKTGVDAISLGCLTHSAKAVDFSLEME